MADAMLGACRRHADRVLLHACAVATLLLASTPVRACEGHAFVRAALDPLPAPLTGMRVEVHRTMGTQLVIENRTGRMLEVLDANGQPFVRVGPAGVDANLAAPSWYTTYSPGAIVPAAAGVDAAPRWTRAAAAPAFGWFDPRLDTAHVPLPPELLTERRAADLGQWIVPLRVDGTPVSLTGRFRYEPPSGAAVARLTSSSAPAPGVRVTLLPGDVPGLLVANAGREILTVLGVDGEPFLRIGPDGVAANLRSRTWRESGRAGTQATVDDVADGPRWQPVASGPRYSWIDPRTRVVTAALDGSTQKWTVPMRLGETPLPVTGSTRWQAASAAGAIATSRP